MDHICPYVACKSVATYPEVWGLRGAILILSCTVVITMVHSILWFRERHHYEERIFTKQKDSHRNLKLSLPKTHELVDTTLSIYIYSTIDATCPIGVKNIIVVNLMCCMYLTLIHFIRMPDRMMYYLIYTKKEKSYLFCLYFTHHYGQNQTNKETTNNYNSSSLC